MSKKKFMILYGFMVRYGENNRWGPGRPPPVVFRQNEMPWLLGLTRGGFYGGPGGPMAPPFLGGGPQVVHPRPPFITIILSLFHYYLGKVHLNSFYHNF